jgi:hypothetical protein
MGKNFVYAQINATEKKRILNFQFLENEKRVSKYFYFFYFFAESDRELPQL